MRLLPPVQVSLCAGCGVTLRERKRKPCPFCRSMTRVLSRTVTETLGAADRV